MFTFKLLVILALVGPVQITVPNLTQEECDNMPNVMGFWVNPKAVVGMSFECVPEESKQDHQWDEKREGKPV